ncbi:conserved protein, unknown function [Hepatocystis sp. ex Piliocolobus tephrosceles]|nr:conserved protein, unknown function [Hepatocystis sp. ex Piliocolobus tephrosceles]
MVLKSKKKKIQSYRYLKKKNAKNYVNKEYNSNDRKAQKNETNYYSEDDLPSYDSNDDILMKDDFFLTILNSDDKSQERTENKPKDILYNENNKNQKKMHIDFLLASIALNIPSALV